MTQNLALFLVLVCGVFAGCNRVALDPKRIDELSKMPYPQSAPAGADLEVHVKQLMGSVEITNLTTNDYHDVQLWLNHQYVAVIKELKVSAGGDSQTIALDKFIDRHRRHYPVGTFLKPDKGYPIVLAEFFDPATGERHRLLVRREVSFTGR